MDKRPIMNKWHARLLSVALVFTVLCGMGWPQKAMVADAVESSVTEVTPGEVALGEVTPGDPEEGEESLADWYLGEIAALKAEAELIDGTTADVTLICADVYERLMAVYDETLDAYDAGEITDEEFAEIEAAAGGVVEYLEVEFGYSPYAMYKGGGGTGSGGSSGTYVLSMDNFLPTSAVYWQVMTGDSTNGYSMASDQNTITSVTLNALNVVHCNSTDSWSGGNTLSNYYPNVSSGSSSVSKTLVVTPAAGYYVTRVIVACTSNGKSSPYNCSTWKSANAYEKEFSVGTSGTVSIDLPSEAFGHSSDSPTYFILIAVAPIPSPLYVEYDYGAIVDYMNTVGVDATVFTGSASTWTTAAATTTVSGTANANYYGTGSVQTPNTQFEYAYAGEDSASEAAKWSHYANTVTPDAKQAAAEAGYYFAGWRAEYYTGITVTSSTGSYNNHNYDFDEDTLYGVGTYSESEKVVLTTNVRLIAQWKPVVLTVTKIVTGLDDTEFEEEHSYTLQVQKKNEAEGWVNYNDSVTLKITGDGTASATLSPIVPGTYRVIETAGNGNLSNGATVMYVTVNSADIAEITNDAIVKGTASTGYELAVTNSYSASAPAVKLVKKWVDASGVPIDANDDSLPDVTFNITDGSKSITKELTSDDYSENENAWIAYVNIADFGSIITVTESAIDGYQLVNGIEQSTIGTEVTINETKCYCTAAYTATNKQSTTEATISKKVEGNMGDLNKQFEFTATLTDANGVFLEFPEPTDGSYKVEDNKAVFRLRNGESVTLTGLPIGSKLTIKEDSGSYVVSVEQGTYNDGITIDVTKDLKVDFTNTYNVQIDTGVLLDSLPYVLILAIVIAGVVVMIIRRRKSYDED